MCGIAGLIGRLDDAARVALGRMNRAMAHRGPDGDAVWESKPDERGWGVALGHRRLAILDLSPAGAQPMTDPVTGWTIAFNGELYNYADVRAGLAAEGQGFDSRGDTAVLVRALGLRGAAALPSLRGMYAFAAWDPGARRLLVARDPLGIKPLYIARNPDPNGTWSIAFASEVRALLASGLLGEVRLAPEAVASVVWNGFVAGPTTAIAGVELLRAGRALELDGHGREVRAFDTSHAKTADRGAATQEELEETLRESVRLHLASDVPLAVFLSSGVDSAAVANLASKAAGGRIHTFTLAFESAEMNEGPIAREIAEAIGAEHHEVLLTEGEFVGHLERALDSLDQPTFDGLNSYYMSRAVRDAGFQVALVGTGGDELFGGYTTFRDLPTLHRWAGRAGSATRRALAWSARRILAARQGNASFPAQTRWAKLPAMLERGDDLVALYQLAYALFLPEFQNELIEPGLADSLAHGLSPGSRVWLGAEIGGRSSLAALGVLERRIFLGERLLRDNDVASMAASVEQRLPLVDAEVFACVERLPDAQRFEPVGRKAALRRIGLAGLPTELFERPKQGFVLPYDRWIRKGLRRALDEALRDEGAAKAAGLRPQAVRQLWEAFLGGAPGLYWSRIWAIFVLIRWTQKNRVFLD